ncbi:DapH/DapD/GlmU-related protein [Mesorhizobium sp. CAU 1741]|uniref:DapH/DapD/GlmU-related protein n=1 Tax=Mesorhizobium sp. CAU 1741 TaxID=3140366 RepID=UPI00325C222D
MSATNSDPKIHSTAELKSCRLGRYVVIGERVILREVTVGDYSYFERHGEGIYTTIGKFCSIAANVRINALEHPMERVTTHKITYRPNEYFKFHGVDQDFRERRRNRPVSIGNDVWIGHGAVIMPGVRIGDGAVIGANAVATKDVGAYEIVAGVPARPIRRRFPVAIAERLSAMAWWDWSTEKLAEALPDMQAMETSQFIDKWSE